MNRRLAIASLVFGLVLASACSRVIRPLELSAPTRTVTQVTHRLDDPLKLECLSSAQRGMFIEWDDVEGERVDFLGLSRESLRGLRTTDIVDLSWHLEQEIRRPYVRVLRNTRTIVLVHFLESHLGGWIIDAVNWCDEPGVPTPIWL